MHGTYPLFDMIVSSNEIDNIITDISCNRSPGRVICFPINAPGMGRFQLLNLGVLGYGLELRFWVVIAIIVSLTLTITLIITLTSI